MPGIPQNGRFREPTKQNKTKQNTADSVVRSGKDSDGIRAVFCFVLFWGKTFRSISDMAGRTDGRTDGPLGTTRDH